VPIPKGLGKMGGTSLLPPPPVMARPVEVTPRAEHKPVASQTAVTTAREAATCKHCGSADLQATYGQYGYYFKCKPCGKNTPIDYKCKACGAKGRIRKEGPRFDRVCGCGAVQLVWTNKD